MTEREFFQVLRLRYPAREYALIPQVRNGTGFSANVRTADAIAISLWPSRGIDMHGFEFKDSRPDWLRELADSSKSDEIGRYCSFWWVVTSNPSIVAPSELPKMWGHISITNGASKIHVKAPRREHANPDISFIASILRSAQESVAGEDEVQRRINAAVAKATAGHYEQVKKSREEGLTAGRNENAALAEAVATFQSFTGLKFIDWNRRPNPHLGKAVQFVLDGGLDGIESRLHGVLDACEKIKRDVIELFPPE